MKSALVLFLGLFTSSAFAQTSAKINFTFFGNGNGQQSYYACTYAEGITSHYIEIMGGTISEIYCSGGITTWSVSPVSISAQFVVPVVTGVSSEVVELRGDTFNPACGINVRTIKELLKFMKNVEVLEKSDACAFANSNFYYKLKINR